MEEARKLLEKLHADVKPLMRKYRWRVGKLTEFVPKDKNLLGLNVNSGAKICIRLRLPDDLTTFFPWEHIVGTMLHELTHNNIAPHNDKFYKFLDNLWEEYEALKDGTRVPGRMQKHIGRLFLMGLRRIPVSESPVCISNSTNNALMCCVCVASFVKFA